MKLLTKELEKKLEKHPLYSQDGKGKDAEAAETPQFHSGCKLCRESHGHVERYDENGDRS